MCGKEDRLERFRRRGLLITACLYTFLFVGSFFGWGPMQLMLEENGAFHWKCDEIESSNGQVCPSQTATLLNIQLIAQTTQIFSPLFGTFLDHYGPLKAALVMATCFWTGQVLLTVASAANRVNPNVDSMLFVAFSLLAVGTWFGGLLTIQTGMYFNGHTKSRVIFLLNALFDGGSITYLILWYTKQGTGTTLTSVALGYLITCVAVVGSGLYFWWVAAPEVCEDDDDDESESSVPAAEMKEEMVPEASPENMKGSSVTDAIGKDGSERRVDHVDVGHSTDGLESAGNDDDLQLPNLEDRVERSVRFSVVDSTMSFDVPEKDDQESDAENTEYVLVAERTVRQQLTSGPFFLLCTFFGIQTASNMWALATARDFLAFLGDDEYDNRYLSIFVLLGPASLVALPFVDAVILKFGFAGAFQAINAIALGYNLVKISSFDLNVQIIGFVLFSFYRSFLFGITFSFMPVLFAPTVVGKAAGTMYCISAITGLISIPLANLAVKKFQGNFFLPNVVFTVLLLPCVVTAYWLGRYIRKENEVKERKTREKQELRLRRSYGGVLIQALADRNRSH